MTTITVRILDGDVTVTTTGFAGKSCLAATLELEKALGRKVSDTPTREMAQTATTAAQSKAGAR